MSQKEKVLLINPEGTVFKSWQNRLLGMIATTYDERRLTRYLDEPAYKLRRRTLGWLAGKKVVDVEPLLDATSDYAEQNMPPWAEIIFDLWGNSNPRDFDGPVTHRIGLWSTTTPKIFINALADGIEEQVPGFRIDYVLGLELETDDEIFTGKTLLKPKTRSIRKLLKEDDLELALAVDSLPRGVGAIAMAEFGLLANPVFDASDEILNSNYRLECSTKYPAITTLWQPGVNHPKTYDLRSPAHIVDFVHDLDPGQVLAY